MIPAAWRSRINLHINTPAVASNIGNVRDQVAIDPPIRSNHLRLVIPYPVVAPVERQPPPHELIHDGILRHTMTVTVRVLGPTLSESV
jgi:hypothetical protein